MELLEVDIVCQHAKISWIVQKWDLRSNRQLSRPPTKRTNPLVGSRHPRYRDRSLIIVKQKIFEKEKPQWATREWNCAGKWLTSRRSRCGCSSRTRWVIFHQDDMTFKPQINGFLCPQDLEEYKYTCEPGHMEWTPLNSNLTMQGIKASNFLSLERTSS